MEADRRTSSLWHKFLLFNHKWVTTIALLAAILLIVLYVRTFCVGSYRISTAAMENTLHEGDYVLVNKFRPGRMSHNQVLLFFSPLMKDRKEAPILVSRCIAEPGDTIQVSNAGYRINGTVYPRSPNALSSYAIEAEMRNYFGEVLRKLNIPLRDMKETSSGGITVSLTSFEEYRIREELTGLMNARFVREETGNYQVIVPRKGEVYRLTGAAITACREAIRAEAEEKVEFRNRKLFLDGRETTQFRFRQDYYWVLSDNINEAVDSRHVGFIPAGNIIGKAWLCWYSKDRERVFKRIY
ncbi:MAG: signal peptidase I [Tannerellaceae bacterium]|jgi:signal peptidase I|nr:signal peptidase I [Tannerellaceae bacterium]